MIKKELMSKDFEEFSKASLLHCIAVMQTILENQVTIISKLENLPRKEVVGQMSLHLSENYKKMSELALKNIQDKNFEGLFYVGVD